MEELLIKAENMNKTPTRIMQPKRALAWGTGIAVLIGILAFVLPFVAKTFFSPGKSP